VQVNAASENANTFDFAEGKKASTFTNQTVSGKESPYGSFSKFSNHAATHFMTASTHA